MDEILLNSILKYYLSVVKIEKAEKPKSLNFALNVFWGRPLLMLRV